jgi:hypothetical protein
VLERRPPECRHHEPKLLDRTDVSRGAVAPESDRLVVPFVVEEVDRVPKGARDAVFLLGRDEAVRVERRDLVRLGLCALRVRLLHCRRIGVAEVREGMGLPVHEFELRVGPLCR